MLCLRACISEREEEERDGARGWRDEGERIRAGAADQACVYTERRQEWRGGEDGKRMKLMYLFCGHPHMLLGERRAGSPREDLTARRMAETTWPGSAAEYQPSVIAFVCKGRLFPSLPPPSPPIHTPLVVSSWRVYAPLDRALRSCRCDSARVALFYILQQK